MNIQISAENNNNQTILSTEIHIWMRFENNVKRDVYVNNTLMNRSDYELCIYKHNVVYLVHINFASLIRR